MTIAELRKLTEQEFFEIATDLENGDIMFAIPIPGAEYLDYERNGDSAVILDPIEDWMDAWKEYETALLATNSPGSPWRRTRKRAQAAGAITDLPNRLAIPTIKGYQNSMNTIDDPKAHLQPIRKDLAQNLQFEDGKLVIKDTHLQGGKPVVKRRNVYSADLSGDYDKSPETLSRLDTPMLMALYSIILDDVKKTSRTTAEIETAMKDPQYLGRSIKIYLPDFLKMLGYSPNISKNMEDYIINKIAGYSSMLGLLEEKENGRIYQSKYPVIVFMGYDARSNTMHFASPYFNMLILKIMESSIQRDKQNRPKLKTNGEPFMKPSHSYLIKSSIAKERNQKAIEIVCVITALIEQAGNNTPHISAQTVIDRCPKLKSALDECEKPKDKNIILKRAFSKAWTLLQEQTHLTEVYKDIQLPSVCKDSIPTTKTLKKVFSFPHSGKAKSGPETE